MGVATMSGGAVFSPDGALSDFEYGTYYRCRKTGRLFSFTPKAPPQEEVRALTYDVDQVNALRRAREYASY